MMWKDVEDYGMWESELESSIVVVRPKKFQFLEKWQNRNFGYEIVISVKKNP